MPTLRVTWDAQVTLPRGCGRNNCYGKISENISENCTGFLPENFDDVLKRTREDLRKRLNQLKGDEEPEAFHQFLVTVSYGDLGHLGDFSYFPLGLSFAS